MSRRDQGCGIKWVQANEVRSNDILTSLNADIVSAVRLWTTSTALCAGMSLLWVGHPAAVIPPPIPLSHRFRQMKKPWRGQPSKEHPTTKKERSLCCQLCPGTYKQKTLKRKYQESTSVAPHQWQQTTAQQCPVVLVSSLVQQSLGSCCTPFGRWITCLTWA